MMAIASMGKNIAFEWCEETGVATCTINNEYGTFNGVAQCHPNDTDMKSEKVGCTIALHRASVQAIKHYKNNIIKPKLSALNQLYYSMNRSKKFNPKSYENKMLQRQLRICKDDLDTVNYMLAEEKIFLQTYIKIKDNYHQRIRAQRKATRTK